MKQSVILATLLMASFISKAQKFYVIGKDDKSRKFVEDKIRFDGYSVVTDSSTSDFTVHLLTDGSYKVISMKRPYEGYIRITNKEGEEVARTDKEKGSPTAFNGYNASYSIYTKLCKKQLPKALEKCKK